MIDCMDNEQGRPGGYWNQPLPCVQKVCQVSSLFHKTFHINNNICIKISIKIKIKSIFGINFYLKDTFYTRCKLKFLNTVIFLIKLANVLWLKFIIIITLIVTIIITIIYRMLKVLSFPNFWINLFSGWSFASYCIFQDLSSPHYMKVQMQGHFLLDPGPLNGLPRHCWVTDPCSWDLTDGQLVTQCFLIVKISGSFGNAYPMTSDEIWSRF